MSSDFILVPGPLVRASSWEPTARHLRDAGHRVQVPDVLAYHDAPPAWNVWTSHLLEQMTSAGAPFVVGHSSASVLAAELATKLPVKGVIIVDGEVPPLQGAASPVRPALHEHIKGVAGADGTLPIWSRWSAGDARRMSLVGLDILASDPVAFARFEAELPNVGWFEDTIELANWDHVRAADVTDL